MVKTSSILLSVVMFVLAFTSPAKALDIPKKPNRLVNDYAQTMSASEVQRLEQKLVRYNDTTSTQIAVVTIPSLQGDDLFDYAQRLAEEWGIGGKENDNGVLLLVAVEERGIRIHTGYGTEGAIPDAIAKRIIENEIKPAFRAGDFYAGYDKATDAMISALAGEYEGTPATTNKKGSRVGFVVILVLFLIFFVFGRRRRYTGYGHSGRRFYGGPIIGGGFGGGGSSFGGGGGFGGFGGGGFGGGGASGSW